MLYSVLRLVPATSSYDAIARLYDPWSRSVTEDVAFYVDEARKVSPGPIVELGVGTGRIALPIAADGIAVIGVDSSAGMLEVCREQAELAGVSALVDLREGDMREPPVVERVPLVLCPFRSFLHLHSDAERLQALGAVHELLLPGGRFVFDVFTPSEADIEETDGHWLEREPGIFERADWDRRRHDADAVTSRARRRGDDGARLAPTGRVASPARASRVSGGALLRLVRPDALLGWRGHDLDHPTCLTLCS